MVSITCFFPENLKDLIKKHFIGTDIGHYSFSEVIKNAVKIQLLKEFKDAEEVLEQ